MMKKIQLVNSVIGSLLSISFRFINDLINFFLKWNNGFNFFFELGKQWLLNIKWSILYHFKVNGSLQVTNIPLENKTYLLCLSWKFAYGKWFGLNSYTFNFLSLSIINIYPLNRHQFGMVLSMHIMLFLKVLFGHSMNVIILIFGMIVDVLTFAYLK